MNRPQYAESRPDAETTPERGTVDPSALGVRIEELEATIRDLRQNHNGSTRPSSAKGGKPAATQDAEPTGLKEGAFSHLSIPAILLDDLGYVVEANPAFAQALGYPSIQPFLRRHLTECCKNPHSALAITSKLREQGAWDGEVELRREKTGIQTLDCSARVISNGNGVIGSILAFEDAAERKLTEAALRESEAHSKIFVENALEGILIHDENNIVNYASPSAVTILGYHESELIGSLVSEFMRPAAAAPAQPDEGSIGVPYGTCFERHCQRKDGSWRIVEATENVLVVDWNIVGFVINFRDVTRRKWAEAKLERVHQDHQDTFAKLPALIWWGSADGAVTALNSYLQEFAGAETEPQGFWQALVHPEDFQRVIETFSAAVPKGAPFRDSFRLRRPDGEFRVYVNAAIPQRDPEGNLTGYIGCLGEEVSRPPSAMGKQ